MSLTYFIISQIKFPISFPSSVISFNVFSASSGFLSITLFTILFINVVLGIPTKSLTLFSSISSSPS